MDFAEIAKLNSRKITLTVTKMFPSSKDSTLFGGSITSKSTGFGTSTTTQSPFQSHPGHGGTSSSIFQPTSGFSTAPAQPGTMFGSSPAQSGGFATPFGGAPVAETARTLQLVEKLATDLTALSQKFDAALAAGQSKPVERVYVACSLHPHVLLETTAAGTEDAVGYTCDICQVSYQNKNEKFYQCASCPSPMGAGKFDVCSACVRKQLGK